MPAIPVTAGPFAGVESDGSFNPEPYVERFDYLTRLGGFVFLGTPLDGERPAPPPREPPSRPRSEFGMLALILAAVAVVVTVIS